MKELCVDVCTHIMYSSSAVLCSLPAVNTKSDCASPAFRIVSTKYSGTW